MLGIMSTSAHNTADDQAQSREAKGTVEEARDDKGVIRKTKNHNIKETQGEHNVAQDLVILYASAHSYMLFETVL